MSSRAKKSSRRPPRNKTDSKAAPSSSKISFTSNTRASESEGSEENDTELEQCLKSFVRLFSVSRSDHGLELSSDFERNLLGSNFTDLVRNVTPKLEQQGTLSSSRHQFALLLLALHHRNEVSTIQNNVIDNAFQVVWAADTTLLVLNLLISTISTCYSPSSYVVFLDSLKALSLVLFENSSHYASEYPRILSVLKPLCDVRIVSDKEVQRVAFNCIANMFYKCGLVGQSQFQDVWNLWMRQVAQLQPQTLTQIGLSRNFAALLRGIQYLIPESHGIYESGLPSLVSMLCKFMFYGTPLGITPSAETADRNSNGSDEDELTSNGSEYSGSDVYNDKYGTWKVRCHALGCLQATAKFSTEKFKQFWGHLLPQSRHQPSLIAILATDPVHQVRSAACRLIQTLFDGQHAFLNASNVKHPIKASPNKNTDVENSSSTSTQQEPGEFSTTPTTPSKTFVSSSRRQTVQTMVSPKSYTPLSMQLSNMLYEVHIGLLNAVTTETRQTTLVAIVKAIAILARETPYDALASGLLVKLIQPIQKCVLEKTYIDHRLLRASISALAALIGARISSNEVIEYVEASHHTLISHLESLLVTDVNYSVKTELFRFFSSLALHHPLIIIPHWKNIFNIIFDTIIGDRALEVDPNTRYAAAKVVDDLSKALLVLTPDNGVLDVFASDLWRNILNSRITELMVKDRFGLVRSAICNLFSQIPSHLFASFTHKHQVVCITLLLGAIKDDVPAVRAQAARALGIYILNQSLKVDPLFVSDVARALVSSMKDKNLNVRAKVAWSAANLCDALVTLREHSSVSGLHSNRNDPIDDFKENGAEEEAIDDLPKDALADLAKGLLSLCKDNDKVRCNAVRAIGNFIRFADSMWFIETETSSLNAHPEKTRYSASKPSNIIIQLVEVLRQLTHEGSAKVRWNACYALANLFHNTSIINESHAISIERSIDSLIAALNTSTNFKVRINATIALHFATLSGAITIAQNSLSHILEAVIYNLKSLEAPDSPGETGYDEKYRDSLCTHLRKLGVSCMHMASRLASSQGLFELCVKEPALINNILETAFQDEPSTPPDQDDSGSHSQLNLPSIQELKLQAQAGLTFLTQCKMNCHST